MASHSTAPIGSPDTFNAFLESEEHQVHQDTMSRAKQEEVVIDHELAVQLESVPAEYSHHETSVTEQNDKEAVAAIDERISESDFCDFSENELGEDSENEPEFKHTAQPESVTFERSSDTTPTTEHSEEESKSTANQHTSENDHGHSEGQTAEHNDNGTESTQQAATDDASSDGEPEEEQVQIPRDELSTHAGQIPNERLHKTGNCSTSQSSTNQGCSSSQPFTDQGSVNVEIQDHLSARTTKTLSDYFHHKPGTAIFPPKASLFEDWGELENLATDDPHGKALEAGLLESQEDEQSGQQSQVFQEHYYYQPDHLDVTNEQDDGQARQNSDLDIQEGHQSPSYFQAGRDFDHAHDNDDDLRQPDYSSGIEQNAEFYQDDELRQPDYFSRIEQNAELYHDEDGPQQAVYSSDNQPYDQIHQDHGRHLGSHLSVLQYSEHHQEQFRQQEAQRSIDDFFPDEVDVQQPHHPQGNQQYSGVYQDQFSPFHSPTQFHPQSPSGSYQQDNFEQDVFIPDEEQVNHSQDTNSAANSIHDEEDDNATIAEEKPELSIFDMFQRIEQLKQQVIASQASIQVMLSKNSENEKRIEEIGAALKSESKRKRSDNVDESGGLPSKKAKTKAPAYRRPSKIKEPKVNAAKATRKPRAASKNEFVEYVPDVQAQAQDANSPYETNYAQRVEGNFDESESQYQDAYQSDVQSYAPATGGQYGQPSRYFQNDYQPNARNYSQSNDSSRQVQSSYQTYTPNYSQSDLDQPIRQVQSAYQQNAPVYSQSPYNSPYKQSASTTTPAQNMYRPDTTCYSQIQDQEFESMINEYYSEPYSSSNNGYSSSAVASTGYPQFPFGEPTSGRSGGNGYRSTHKSPTQGSQIMYK